MDKDSYTQDEDMCKWLLILSRISYCFKQADEDVTEIVNKYAEEYNKQVWGDEEDYFKTKKSFKEFWNRHTTVIEYDENNKPKLYELNLNEADPELKKKYFDEVNRIDEYRNKMKDEGFDLLKKYFWHLWD